MTKQFQRHTFGAQHTLTGLYLYSISFKELFSFKNYSYLHRLL